ncbi:MAG: hypothetical protein AB1796_09200 [Bacillota bacterium]
MYKNQVPDVTSFRLETAKKLLEERNISYLIKETIPVRPVGREKPLSDKYSPVYRVIRQKVVKGGMVEIVVARESAALA